MVAGKNKIIGKLKNFKRYYSTLLMEVKINTLNKILDYTIKRINEHIKKQNTIVTHMVFTDDLASKIILKKLLSVNERTICNIIGKDENDSSIVKPKEYLKTHSKNLWNANIHTTTESEFQEAKELLKDYKLGIPDSLFVQYYNIFKKIHDRTSTQHIIICDFSKELFAGCPYHKNKNAEVYENIIKNTIPVYLETIDLLSEYFGLIVWFPYLGIDVLKEIENFTMDQMFYDWAGEYPLRRISEIIKIPGEIEIEEKEIINLLC